METLDTGGNQVLTFTGSRYWISNVWGAIVGGLGGAILMTAVALLVASGTESPEMLLAMAGWIAMLLVSVLALFPGNLVARLPYEVVIEKGNGLRLRAPFKELYIPIQDVRDVRRILLQGCVVHLKRRHGLLTHVVIHRIFGKQAPLLADAIQQEIQRR